MIYWFVAVDLWWSVSPGQWPDYHTAGTTFGQTAIYSCNTGYTLVGESILMV